MRLHFSLSPNTSDVPFNYFHFLSGAFHKIMGENNIHNGLSLYSLSALQGGGARKGALDFPRGASWFVSAPDDEQGQQLLTTLAQNAPEGTLICCGMRIKERQTQATPEFGDKQMFLANSPIFLRGERREDGYDPHLIYSDEGADDLLTHVLRKKLCAANMEQHAATATMRFDRAFKNPKTRLIEIMESKRRASVCPVIVEGTPEAVQFAWNVGAGHGTGMAFGSLI